MQYFKILKTRTGTIISLISVIALFIGFTVTILLFGIRKTIVDFEVSAEPVPDGILLKFRNIPEDTTDISLTFVDINAKDKSETVVVVNFDALDELKKTGNLICPFAENGKEYLIRIYRLMGTETAEKIVAGFVAGGGIYLTNTPLLHFSNENNTFTLSEMPEFSEKVVFSTDEFLNYYTYAKRDNGLFIGIDGEATDSLTSSVSVQPTEDTAGMFPDLLTDKLPIYGTAHCLLEYKNLEWIVQIAKSEDVIVSF